MKTTSFVAAFALALALALGSWEAGYAQTAADLAAPAAGTVKPEATSDSAKKAKAKECSLKADAQKLHGEARKAFREKCKKAVAL